MHRLFFPLFALSTLYQPHSRSVCFCSYAWSSAGDCWELTLLAIDCNGRPQYLQKLSWLPLRMVECRRLLGGHARRTPELERPTATPEKPRSAFITNGRVPAMLEVTPAGHRIGTTDRDTCRSVLGSHYVWSSAGDCWEVTPAATHWNRGPELLPQQLIFFIVIATASLRAGSNPYLGFEKEWICFTTFAMTIHVTS